jgi:hypothetical protein
MTFTAEIAPKGKRSIGDKWLMHGTYANTDGSTGGDITTSLTKVDFLILQPYGTAVTDKPTVNETFPCDDGITVVTTANQVGIWIAMGD